VVVIALFALVALGQLALTFALLRLLSQMAHRDGVVLDLAMRVGGIMELWRVQQGASPAAARPAGEPILQSPEEMEREWEGQVSEWKRQAADWASRHMNRPSRAEGSDEESVARDA